MSQVVVVHTFNPSTRKAEAGRSLWVLDQPSLQSKFQNRLQSYTQKLCLKKHKTKQKSAYESFACITHVCTLHVCTLHVCTLHVCTLRVCTLHVCTLYVCTLHVCTLHVCTLHVCLRESEEVVGSSDPELWMIMNHHTCALGTKPWFYARATSPWNQLGQFSSPT